MLSSTRSGILYMGADIDVAGLLTHLADRLDQASASTVDVQGQRVMFTAGMLRLVTNWNVLVPFDSGVITVDAAARQVLYEVSCRRLILLGTGMVCLMTVFILFARVWGAILAMPIMWLWLVGGNIVLGKLRFEGFLGRAIASAPHICRPSQLSERVLS
jgi:hypothetical protein